MEDERGDPADGVLEELDGWVHVAAAEGGDDGAEVSGAEEADEFAHGFDWRELSGKTGSGPCAVAGQPDFAGHHDVILFAARAEFPDDGDVVGDEREESVVIDTALEGNAVVLVRPDDIVEVAAEKPGSHLEEPFFVIEQAEIGLELNVTEVVPVADPWSVEVCEELDHFAFRGYLFVVAAAFDGDGDAGFFGGGGDLGEGLPGALEVEGAEGLAFADHGEFAACEFAAADFSGGGEVLELLHGMAHGDGAHVEDDVLGFEFRGEFEGAEGEFEGAFAVELAVAGEFVGIRGVDEDLDR